MWRSYQIAKVFLRGDFKSQNQYAIAHARKIWVDGGTQEKEFVCPLQSFYISIASAIEKEMTK